MNLTKTAINRPVFTLMMMLAAILMGVIGFNSMRKEQNPDVSFGTITILAIYPGANPEEVATLVSRPIEEAISGVNGLQNVTSTSVEGRSVVVAQMELTVNIDVALNDIRSKVDAIVGQLPSEVEKPTISKIDTASTPVAYYAISAKNMSGPALRTLVDDRLKDQFARIPGVAEVGVQGGDIREIQVAVRKDQLLKYGIGLADVQRAIATANLNSPAGRIVKGDQELSVRVPGEFRSVNDLENLRFTISNPENPQAKGRIVRLGDVATVTDGIQERTAYSTLNGADTIVLVLSKAKEGNAIEVVKAGDKLAEQLTKQYEKDGLTIIKTQDTGKTVEQAIDSVEFELIFGIILVSIIVYIFLHNLRGTLIVSLAIPTCLAATLAAIAIAGFTINNLTMLALALAIGVLVDDAIVVLENIYRHLKMGEDPREAALNGRAEIGLAAIAITLADVVVFLPLAFLGGIVGQFFRPLALAYVIAVLFSLFVSFTLTPMLAARWYRRGEDVEHPKGRFAQWFEARFARLEDRYRRVLEWSLANRWFVFITGNIVLMGVFMMIQGGIQPDVPSAIMKSTGVAGVIVIIGLIAFGVTALVMRQVRPRIVWGAACFAALFPLFSVGGFALQQWKGEDLFKFSFFPSSDEGRININIQLPPGRSLAETERVVKTVEERIKGIPDIQFTLATIGSQGVSQFQAGSSGSNYAQIIATLKDKWVLKDVIVPWKAPKGPLRYRSDEAIIAEMIQKVGRVPGAEIRISRADGFGIGSPIQMSFSGPNREELLETVSEIKRGLAAGAVPGVINPDISSKPGKPEVQAVPDRTRLADAGLSVATLGSALRVAYTGDDTAKYREGGREFPIRVMLDLEDRNNPNILNELPVSYVRGEPVYVSSVADLTTGTSTDKIERRNRAEEIRVTADLLPGVPAGLAQAQIDAWLTREKLVPASITINPLGQAESQQRESGALLGALFLGLLLVYMLLASLYDNLLYPFIIQLAQPQAFVGGLLALIITDKAFTLIGFIGLIALIGLVGKNAILLVDYTNTLRARGRNRHDALVEAGPVRLRPIMMTTIALVIGLLPIALAIGRGSEFRESLGILIIGGITLSTILTLVVIPCSYTIFDDLALRFRRKSRDNDDAGASTGNPKPEDASPNLPSTAVPGT